MKPKGTIKANIFILCVHKRQKSAKMPNQNFQGQTPPKKPNSIYLALLKAKRQPRLNLP